MQIIHLDVRYMLNPPRQKERFVKVTMWQCLDVQRHKGELHEATDKIE